MFIKYSKKVSYFYLKLFFITLYKIKAFLFLYLNKKKFTKEKFYIVSHWSFGWQVVFLFLIYAYSKKKKNYDINIVNFIYPRNNPEMASFFFNKRKIFNYQVNMKYNFFNRISHESLLKVINFFPEIKKNLITNEELYVFFGYKSKEFYIWNFENNNLEKYFNFKWYDDLVNKFKLTQHDIQKSFFKKTEIMFGNRLGQILNNKKIGSISLRDKYSNYPTDKVRQLFKINNYIYGIKWLIKNKNFVFINHNKNYDSYFSGINGVINLSDFANNTQEFYAMNLYIYFINDIFISTHSGSHFFTALFKKKIMLGDVWPISQGVTGKKNIILLANHCLNKKKLSLRKICKDHVNFFYGYYDYNKAKKNYEIFANTKSQILNMVKEKKLVKIKFFPKRSLAYYRNNWFCVE